MGTYDKLYRFYNKKINSNESCSFSYRKIYSLMSNDFITFAFGLLFNHTLESVFACIAALCFSVGENSEMSYKAIFKHTLIATLIGGIGIFSRDFCWTTLGWNYFHHVYLFFFCNWLWATSEFLILLELWLPCSWLSLLECQSEEMKSIYISLFKRVLLFTYFGMWSNARLSSSWKTISTLNIKFSRTC